MTPSPRGTGLRWGNKDGRPGRHGASTGHEHFHYVRVCHCGLSIGEDEEESMAASSRAASGSGAHPLKAEEATRNSPSAKNINRRSMSLNVGISSSAKPQITPAYVSVNAASHRTTEAPETLPISHSISEGHSGALLPSNGSPPNSYPHPGPNVRPLPNQPYHGPQSQGSGPSRAL